MSKYPKELIDTDLDDAQGGGLLDTESGTFGFEPITLERGVHPANRHSHDLGYIGETEKNVWKAPAGLDARKS